MRTVDLSSISYSGIASVEISTQPVWTGGMIAADNRFNGYMGMSVPHRDVDLDHPPPEDSSSPPLLISP